MSKVVLILGAGPRVGAAIAEKFSSGGYKVAVTSRKGTNSVSEKGYLSVKADFANPASIPPVFSTVTAKFGAPNIVIYNAASLTPPSDESTVLSIPADRIQNDLTINVTSPWVAAQEAEKAFQTLPADSSRLFLYTGNILNVQVIPVPLFATLGMGKAASAFWLGLLDQTSASKGYRFIYSDQRTETGSLAGNDLDGPANADWYWSLAQNNAKDVPWHATFVKGKGYVKF